MLFDGNQGFCASGRQFFHIENLTNPFLSKQQIPHYRQLMPLKKITVLQKNDLIRIVAPSSPFDKQAFMAGVSVLKQWGFKIRYQKDIFAKKDYLAGDDKRRACELIAALRDKKTKAILFARGGYGVMRLLPYLDKARLNPKPKIVLGCSDITPLLDYCRTRFGWPTFYGPNVISEGLHNEKDVLTRSAFLQCLTAKKAWLKKTFPQSKIMRHGTAVAPIVGGCLTLICATMGTPYEMNTDNKILFLEDTGEKPYRIDRLLTQLKLAGKFKKCRGIIFGASLAHASMQENIKLIRDVLGEFRIPIVFNFPMGHTKQMVTVPLGVKAKLDTQKKTLAIV